MKNELKTLGKAFPLQTSNPSQSQLQQRKSTPMATSTVTQLNKQTNRRQTQSDKDKFNKNTDIPTELTITNNHPHSTDNSFV